jgi:hypothetical protein
VNRNPPPQPHPRNLATQAGYAPFPAYLHLPHQPAHVPGPTPASLALRRQPYTWTSVAFAEPRVIRGRS